MAENIYWTYKVELKSYLLHIWQTKNRWISIIPSHISRTIFDTCNFSEIQIQSTTICIDIQLQSEIDFTYDVSKNSGKKRFKDTRVLCTRKMHISILSYRSFSSSIFIAKNLVKMYVHNVYYTLFMMKKNKHLLCMYKRCRYIAMHA